MNLRQENSEVSPDISFPSLPSIAVTRAGSGVLVEDDHERHEDADRPENKHMNVTGGLDTTRPSADMSASSLETDVARELRRVSRLSGLSNLSGSIMLLNESSVQTSSSKELGPGSSQSSSSKAPSNEMRGYGIRQSTRPTASDIPRMWTDTERIGMASKAGFAKSFQSSPRDDDIGAYEDEEDDWETIGESGVLKTMESQPGIARAVSGSSLTEDSSNVDVSPENCNYTFLGDSEGMPKHPADQRYDHVYRIRHTTPHGDPILLPAYNFEGIGFPNRNALTSPVPASPGSGNTYRHPTPLRADHLHPFRSSPPVISTSGRAVPHTTQEEMNTPTIKSHMRKNGVDLARSPQDTLRHFDFGFDTGNQGSTIVNSQANNEVGRHVSELPYIPSGNGSFSKLTTLGTKMNVTGTPQGTGMKEAGSSLAGVSSSPRQWSSDAKSANLLQVPRPAMVRSPVSFGWDRDEAKSPVGWQESVRRHREHLIAEGLLPRTVTPPGGRPGSIFSRESSLFSISPSTYLYAFGRPISYNPTPPLPRNQSQQASELEFRLRRLPKGDAFLSPMLRRRKKLLSRVVLAVCCVLTPLCLLYGYGFMDRLMMRFSRDEIEEFGRRQKIVALVVGWTWGFLLISGIIIVMVVISKTK